MTSKQRKSRRTRMIIANEASAQNLNVVKVSKKSRTCKKWADEDLDMIFKVFPTKENAASLGRIMGRTPGSILLAWTFSINTKKVNMTLGRRGVFGERCRTARVRAGWML